MNEMSNQLSGWIIMLGIAACLLATIWTGYVEMREERSANKKAAEDAKFLRDRMHRQYIDQIATLDQSPDFTAVMAETERMIGSPISDAEFASASAYCAKKYDLEHTAHSDYYIAMLITDQIRSDRFSAATQACEPFFRVGRNKKTNEKAG